MSKLPIAIANKKKALIEYANWYQYRAVNSKDQFNL